MKIYILVTHDDLGEDMNVRAFHTLLSATQAMREVFDDDLAAVTDAGKAPDPEDILAPTIQGDGYAEYRIPGYSGGQIQSAQL